MVRTRRENTGYRLNALKGTKYILIKRSGLDKYLLLYVASPSLHVTQNRVQPDVHHSLPCAL